MSNRCSGIFTSDGKVFHARKEGIGMVYLGHRDTGMAGVQAGVLNGREQDLGK